MPSDDLLMMVDGMGLVVEWSRPAEELLGRSGEEVVGRPAAVLVTDTDPDPGQDAPALRHRDGHPVATELRVRPVVRPDSSVLWAVHRAADSEGSPTDGTALLEALFARSPAGLHILDADLRIIQTNTAAQTLCAEPAERLLGHRITDVYDLFSPSRVDAMLREVLESGAPAPERPEAAHSKARPGRRCMLSLSAFRLQDPQGTVLGAAVIVRDVTAVHAARDRTRILEAVRDRVGQTLDVVATCEDLADSLVPSFADVAVVEVVDSVVRGEEPPLGSAARGVPLRRAAACSGSRQYDVRAHPVGDVRSLPAPTPYSQSLTDLRPRLVALGPQTPWLEADPARAEAIRAGGAHSLIVAPLSLRGMVLGLVSLYRTERGAGFDEDDVDLALLVASHGALSIDNARRFTREHTVATTIHQHLLPQRPASQTTVETAHAQEFGESGGGGWFDVFGLSGGRTALVVGEVSGQTIHTAAAMGQLRTVIRSLSALDQEPDELLARVNDTVNQLAAERTALPPGDPLRREALTASCLYAIYDPFTCSCTIARAGHPSPVIAHPDGSVEIPDLPKRAPLGADEGLPFSATTLNLADGSVLGFYTPALLEARPHSLEILRQTLAGADRSLQGLCDDALYRLRASTTHTDALLLLARIHPFPASVTADWPLQDSLEAAATARALVRRRLTDWNQPAETVDSTELIVSELVTNAVRYGRAPRRLRVIRDHVLTCEVHDSNDTAPRMHHAHTVDEGGRGLFIVGQVADNWGTRYTEEGKAVWTEQILPDT
ncbi:PAS domain S-box-containing protein [Actinacidiphila yanglinensis]|uniref:PAS domain S-box-containing protein n=1 Tax=Actinacidiphila yanglinensis TaxID=310779 RepID=A0A1H6CJQ3_9ACTN|nr:SpoIIE family protein phosphatase [Actinacidiphila yanglinensis]SEG72636.1 PAS domain S-box-containing protein [Actinacidiphila yanglinensis]